MADDGVGAFTFRPSIACYRVGQYGAYCCMLSSMHLPIAGVVSPTLPLGVLSLDEFKEVNMQDYFNYMAKKKANMSDFVRNSQQTWLDQGKGAHPVIHSIQQR